MTTQMENELRQMYLTNDENELLNELRMED